MNEQEIKQLAALLRKLADELEAARALPGSDQLELVPSQPKARKSSPRGSERRTAAKFDEFWAVYPPVRKVARVKCRQKWLAQGLDKLGDMIIADVKARTRDDAQWDAGFVPAPLTYLNQRRWEDEIITKERAPAGPTNQREWLHWASANGITAWAGESMSDFLIRVQRIRNERPAA